MKTQNRLVRIVERHSNIQQFVGVETTMTDDGLNLAAAHIQYVRNQLPLMLIQHNDTMDTPDMAHALSRLCGCKAIIEDGKPTHDAELDLFENWNCAHEGVDFSSTKLDPRKIAAVLFEDFIKQAKEIMAKKSPPDPKQVLEYEQLMAMSQGKPVLPEWGLESIFERPVVGVLI